MKLSDLETLVKAMRERSRMAGITNPRVEFWGGDADIRHAGSPFLNMELEPGLIDELHHHVVLMDGDVARKGDFALPLKLI